MTTLEVCCEHNGAFCADSPEGAQALLALWASLVTGLPLDRIQVSKLADLAPRTVRVWAETLLAHTGCQGRVRPVHWRGVAIDAIKPDMTVTVHEGGRVAVSWALPAPDPHLAGLLAAAVCVDYIATRTAG